MRMLAFDTSSSACSVALLNQGEIKCLHKIAPMQQTNLILPFVHELLESCSLSLNQLDAIAFGSGPGSFTGIRIASSVAQGLSFPYDIPLIPVSSLAILAQTAYLTQKRPHVLVALDARVDQIYWAYYAVDESEAISLVGQEQCCLLSQLSLPSTLLAKNKLNPEEWCGVGDGWVKYGDQLMTEIGFRPSQLETELAPEASALIDLAQIKFKLGLKVSSMKAIPTYLR